MWKAIVVAALIGCGGAGTATGGDGGGDEAGGGDGPGGDAAGVTSPEDLIRACIVINGCLDISLETCARYYGKTLSATQVDCILAAGGAGCPATRACLGSTIVQDPACVPGCSDAHTSVRCSGGFRVSYDCQTYVEDVGPNCVTGATRFDCGGTTCTLDGEYTCAGEVSSTCDSGITEVVDCAQFGLECIPTSRRCYGALTGTCTVGTATVCNGTEIVECFNGEERRTDCDRQVHGMTCVAGSGAPTCAFGAACTAGGATCAGTTLSVCIAGRQVTQDCTMLGFASCASSASSARCQ